MFGSESDQLKKLWNLNSKVHLGKSKKYFLVILAGLACSCAKNSNKNAENTAQAPTANPAKSEQEISKTCTIKFKNSGNCLSWSWDNEPKDDGDGSMTFRVYRFDETTGAVVPQDSSFQLSLALGMPSMPQHGIDNFAAEKIEVGVYKVPNLSFRMPGEWEMKFQIIDNEQVLDEAILLIDRQ